MPGSGPLVLVVDDQRDVRIALRRILLERGYRVEVAADGAEALAILSVLDEVPAVVVADLWMPGMDGWRLIGRMQEDPRLAAVPVIVITAALQEQQEIVGIRIAELVSKPFEIDALLAAVERHRGGG